MIKETLEAIGGILLLILLFLLWTFGTPEQLSGEADITREAEKTGGGP